MTNKHTPGPWSIQDNHGKRWTETTSGNDDSICEIHRRDIGSKHRKLAAIDDEEFQANARLIAAAPELMEALEALLSAVDGNHVTEGDCNQARSAIAKATGEAQ